MPILMYHRIAADGPKSLVRWRVPAAEFERQLAHLAAGGYSSIGLAEWLTVRQSDPASLARRVALTFDDAYKDFVTTGFPLLQRYGFGATMFVPTQFMGGFADWDRDFGAPAPLMTWDELTALADAGIEIGAHTVSHPRLTRLQDEAEIVREIVGSRSELEARFHRPVTTFAYPWGDYDARVEKIVRAAGFRCAVTIVPESAGPFALGRIGVYGDETFDVFREKLARAAKD